MDLTQTQLYVAPPGYFRRLGIIDWLYAAALAVGALFALNRYGQYMDGYEKAILLLSTPVLAWLGWQWKQIRWLMATLAVLALGAIALYGGNLEAANNRFFLRYALSSQSAILWMSTLFFLSTLF